MKIHTLPLLLAAATIALPAQGKDSPEMAARPTPRVIISTEMNARDLSFFTGANAAESQLIALCQLGSKRASLPEVRKLADAIGKSQAEDFAALQKLAGAVSYTLPQYTPAPGSTGGLETAEGARADKLFLDQLAASLDTLVTSLQGGEASGSQAIAAYSKTALAKATAVRTALKQMGM